MTRQLLLTEQHVRRFAAACGDHNPLHVDELFARRTPYGRCIAHGALVTIAALGSADPRTLARARELDVRFKHPVFPGASYSVSSSPAGGERTRIALGAAGQEAVVVTVVADPAGPPLPEAPGATAGAAASSPRHYGTDGLPDPGLSITERYGCRLGLLRSLAFDVGAADVPDTVLTWLAAASYTVGMLIPGRDGVFAGARILRSSADASGALRADVATMDDRSGLVIVQAGLDQGDASARMTLQTFARPSPPAPDRASIARHLPPSNDLEGRKILVVGASRGLGAALCGALSTRQATVWAGFARSADEADRVRREFGGQRIRLLQFDAANVRECRRAFQALREQAGTLDGVILCAAPALEDMALRPEASERILRSIQETVAMALIPLAEALPLLSPRGCVVVVSSSALDDPPAARPHHVAAKAVIEGLAAYCARHSGARVVVARPPRMWTDGTNMPLARLGAAAPEQVAAGIVRAIAGEEGGSRASVLLPEDLLQAP